MTTASPVLSAPRSGDEDARAERVAITTGTFVFTVSLERVRVN
jgi:hypothetical protein